jgi:hypothetical protein
METLLTEWSAASRKSSDTQPTFDVGAHLVSERDGYTHHGIYAGNGQVIHYGGFDRSMMPRPIEYASLTDFAEGNDIIVASERDVVYTGIDALQRAKSRLGENRYQLLTNNCEHFSTWCVRGVACSEQVRLCLRNPWKGVRTVLAIARAMFFASRDTDGTIFHHARLVDQNSVNNPSFIDTIANLQTTLQFSAAKATACFESSSMPGLDDIAWISAAILIVMALLIWLTTPSIRRDRQPPVTCRDQIFAAVYAGANPAAMPANATYTARRAAALCQPRQMQRRFRCQWVRNSRSCGTMASASSPGGDTPTRTAAATSCWCSPQPNTRYPPASIASLMNSA